MWYWTVPISPDPATCPGAAQVNFVSVPHQPADNARADNKRAKFTSRFGETLFRYYDSVIFTDADEFLVLDPNIGGGLACYLSQLKPRISVAALGVDVIHDPAHEPALDPSQPYLAQRHFGQIDSRYTKPSILFHPARRSGGGHRLKYRASPIDPNLYLFHFGLVDYQQSLTKLALILGEESGRLRQGYLKARQAEFADSVGMSVLDGDTEFPKARQYQTWKRSWKHPLNPGKMTDGPRISIPERFRQTV